MPAILRHTVVKLFKVHLAISYLKFLFISWHSIRGHGVVQIKIEVKLWNHIEMSKEYCRRMKGFKLRKNYNNVVKDVNPHAALIFN